MKRWLIVGLLLSLSTVVDASAERPNVVVILADDLGYADISVHGCTDIKTPNIDRLAETGVRCTDGYVTHPFCSPTRAALVTGRYQQRFGNENNPWYDPQNPFLGLHVKERTIADRLKAAGYRSGIIGKWHLGTAHVFHPARRGFDYFFGFLGGGHDYFRVDLRRPLGGGYYLPLEENGKPLDLNGYLTDVLTDAAVRFIEENRDKPFFLYVAYNAPHTPLQAPEAYLERTRSIEHPKRRIYAAMVLALDEGVGRILDALERTGQRERTLVFFLSDNGGIPRTSGSSNRPLRGTKGMVYEGGIRVPFLVSWPGTLPEGATYSHPVSSLDIAATAAALAGLNRQQTRDLEGVNLVPYLTGQKEGEPHEALFWRTGGGDQWAVRAGRWKLLQPGPDRPLELYDLSRDISESKNLFQEQTAVAARLRALYEAWNRDNIPPRFPNPQPYRRRMMEAYRAFEQGSR